MSARKDPKAPHNQPFKLPSNPSKKKASRD